MSRIGFRPGVEVDVRFQPAVSTAVPVLSPYVIGPLARVVRYDRPSEKPLGLLGSYSTSGQNWNNYDYPQRQGGDVVDLDFIKLNVDKGLLEYWTQASGTMAATSLTTIRHPSLNFTSNPGFPSSSVFGDRGVRVGDRVLIKGVRANTNPFTLATTVAGFVSDQSATSIGSPITSPTNQVAQPDDDDITPGSGNSGNTTDSLNSANYDGLAAGILTETYFIEVIQGSTGGDATTARLRVTSGSGTDDVLVLVPDDFGDPTPIGTRGLLVTFDQNTTGEFTVGDTWNVLVKQEYAAPTVTAAGTYAPTDGLSRNYVVRVLTGAKYDESPIIQVSEARGLDIVQTYTLSDAVSPANTTVAVPLGSFGLTVAFTAAFGLVTGDSWSIAAVGSQPTNVRTLRLANTLPADIVLDSAGANLEVTLFIQGDFEITRQSAIPGAFNWEATPSELKVSTSVNLFEPSWTVAGVPQPLPLVSVSEFVGSSQLYITHRMWVATQSAINAITTFEEFDSLFVGPNDADNPLKFAVGQAFRGSAGRAVFYFNVGDPSVPANWNTALVASETVQGAYGIVPLTQDQTVLSSVATFVQARSAPDSNTDKVAWFTLPDVDLFTVVGDSTSSDGQQVLATVIDDPDTSGTQFTLLTVSSNASLLELGVRPGDQVRINYQTDAWGEQSFETYQVDTVINESSLKLVSGPALQVSTPSLVNIVRTTTADDYVSIVENRLTPDGALGTSFYSSFLNRVIPYGSVFIGNTKVPSYFMAAYLAGVRSALAPHQSLTRWQVAGFTGANLPRGITNSQLNRIAAAGSFIVAFDAQLGRFVVRHGVTAGDYDDVNNREESIISNVHSIKFALFAVLDPYIGRANVTDELLAIISTDILSLEQVLTSANAGPFLGGQLIDLIILDIRQSPIAKDTILVDVEITVPAPVNRIRLTLFVN